MNAPVRNRHRYAHPARSTFPVLPALAILLTLAGLAGFLVGWYGVDLGDLDLVSSTHDDAVQRFVEGRDLQTPEEKAASVEALAIALKAKIMDRDVDPVVYERLLARARRDARAREAREAIERERYEAQRRRRERESEARRARNERRQRARQAAWEAEEARRAGEARRAEETRRREEERRAAEEARVRAEREAKAEEERDRLERSYPEVGRTKAEAAERLRGLVAEVAKISRTSPEKLDVRVWDLVEEAWRYVALMEARPILLRTMGLSEDRVRILVTEAFDGIREILREAS